ncbi:transketolase C-terminal domain-containing protein [Marispirochaeta aestuarii]|uniref:transketolase family protein n=1 Tax=Marispirochaeta aestuarii TaxID=1963862 RepID=UPI0029C61F3A|nr:transketolase C-terminal domain-containing protein [Marispirochaeta aestuarii]
MATAKVSDKQVSMRDAFGQALVEIGKTKPELVVLDADVSSSTKTGLFGAAYPDRFFNVGVAEANMTDVAAGLATCGYRPVISTFALFLALKCTDQIRNVICYNNLPVVIVAGYGGLSDSFDGASHQALTDIAIMRALPNMRVVVAADGKEAEEALKEALEHDGPTYIRISRNPAPLLEIDEPFKTGKGRILREGKDCTIATAGVPVPMALEAAEKLAAEGISAEVLELHTIKPVDTDLLKKSVGKTGAVVSAEEHNIYGGIGGAVAEALSRSTPAPMEYVGVADTFTESGPYDTLLTKYGISVEAITEAVKKAVKRKA